MHNDFILRYEGVYSEDERKRIIKEIDLGTKCIDSIKKILEGNLVIYL